MLYTSKLQVSLSEADIYRMLRRYHYEEKDLEMIIHLYYAIEPVINPWCYYELAPSRLSIVDETHVSVLVTLGKGIDGMIEAYEAADCMEEAYMLDCIGSELLWNAYGKIHEMLQESKGLWQTKMEFIGDKYPIEIIGTVVDNIEAEWNERYHRDGQEKFHEKIRYNEAYILSPGKSAVYIAKVQKNKPKHMQSPCENICLNCTNQTCLNRSVSVEECNDVDICVNKKMNHNIDNSRKWTYGYQTIFRKRDTEDDSKNE